MASYALMTWISIIFKCMAIIATLDRIITLYNSNKKRLETQPRRLSFTTPSSNWSNVQSRYRLWTFVLYLISSVFFLLEAILSDTLHTPLDNVPSVLFLTYDMATVHGQVQVVAVTLGSIFFYASLICFSFSTIQRYERIGLILPHSLLYRFLKGLKCFQVALLTLAIVCWVSQNIYQGVYGIVGLIQSFPRIIGLVSQFSGSILLVLILATEATFNIRFLIAIPYKHTLHNTANASFWQDPKTKTVIHFMALVLIDASCIALFLLSQAKVLSESETIQILSSWVLFRLIIAYRLIELFALHVLGRGKPSQKAVMTSNVTELSTVDSCMPASTAQPSLSRNKSSMFESDMIG